MPKIAMTATWVHKIKSDKLQENCYDLAMDRGVSLILRVSRSGSKIWQVIYRPKGEDVRKRFKIGEYPPMSLADARGRAYAIRDDHKDGGDPQGNVRQPRLRRLSGKSPRSISSATQ